MALDNVVLRLVAALFGLGAIYVALRRRRMPTWRAGVMMLTGCTLLTIARVMQFSTPAYASHLFWFKVFFSGLLMLPTGFLILSIRYSGLGYWFTPRTSILINAFPILTIILIFTNEFHGWIWHTDYSTALVYSPNFIPPEAAGIWYWLIIAHSMFCMGLGCYLLNGVRKRSYQTSRWQLRLVIVASLLATLGPALDIFQISPLRPFFATLIGILIGAIALFTNISPLRKRDLLLISRGTIIQNMSDPVIAVDKDNYIIDINPAAEMLSNKPISALMGETMDVAFPELRAVWEDNAPKHGEIIFANTHPPQTLEYRVSTIKDWQDQVISKMLVLRDITERKQASEELSTLRQAEQNFSQQLTVLTKVTQALSKANTLEELCLRAIEMGRDPLGFDRLSLWFVTEHHEKMIGTFGTSIEGEITNEWGVEHIIRPTTHMMPVLRGEEALQSYENAPLYRADGQQVGVGTRITAGLWDGQAVIGFLSVDNQIHHQPFSEYDKEIIRLYASTLGHLCTLKRAQEALYELKETLEHRVVDRTRELETANKELEAFAYSISHDLRAPIRAVGGYATLLIENYGANLDPEGQRISNIIQKEARRMGHLIDDLLTFSRFSRTEMRRTSVDMHSLATTIANELAPPDDLSRLEIMITPLSPAWGDYGLLQQVWTNLISNSIKFTSKREKASIHIQSEANGEQVTYSIQDNGVGFDMTYVHKLFGVFQRLHTDQEFPGTGAGLAIVQRIIARHGGKIWAESEEGVGTTFFFTLPSGG